MSRRIERVNELLLQEISRTVMERQHPDIGFITFTGVQATDDLTEAKVFYSVLGSDEDKQRTARALGSMRRELLLSMRRLESLKYIPHFHFIYDDTAEKASRVHDLIGIIQHEPPVPPVVEEAPPAAAEPSAASAPDSEPAPAPKRKPTGAEKKAKKTPPKTPKGSARAPRKKKK